MNRICPEGKVLNPLTNRCITKNGAIHLKLLKDGVQVENIEKKCSNGKVLNTHTNRCIKIGSQLYKIALKNGWIKEENKVNQVVLTKPDPVCKKRNCKNDITFMLMNDVHEITNKDFLRTPDGYCFSTEELLLFIKSDGFKNKNPHALELDLFDKDKVDEKYIKEHPELHKLVKEYFIKLKKEQSNFTTIYKNTIDVLYEICNTGRICYFNQITSHNTNNSSIFEKSIQALSDLSVKLERLNNTEKKAYKFVIDKVKSANEGNMCIHGIGLNLIEFFINEFIKLDLVYDVNKTELYFIKQDNKIFFISYEHRFYLNQTRSTHSIIKTIKKVKDNMLSKKRDEKSKLFEKKCNFEPFLVTTESLDSWLELEDWRKVIFKDNSCFDLFFLIKNMTTDLNNAKSNNPLPRYPLNPFTQKVYSNDELSHIRSLCNDNFVNLNPALDLFLSDSANWNNNSTWSNNFIDYLENKNLRFVRLNNILGNELHCIGYWDKKNTPHSKTERLILDYINNLKFNNLNILKKINNENVPDNYYYIIDNNISSGLNIL